MTTGDLLVYPYAVELRGVAFDLAGGFGLSGPIDGLGNAEQTGENVNRPLSHGVYPGRSWLRTRNLVFPFVILGDDPDDALARYLELTGAWRPVDETLDAGELTVELAFTIAGGSYLAIGKPGPIAPPDLTLLPNGAVIEADAEFLATDPRIYGLELNEVAVGLGAGVSGGLDVPHGFPHAFGAAVSSVIDAPNGGNFPTYPVVTFTAGAGGLINPVIEHVAKAEALTVIIELADGDELEVDLDNRTVILNGSASRTSYVKRPGSRWPSLDPGANVLRFGADSGAGTMTARWRDAYHFG